MGLGFVWKCFFLTYESEYELVKSSVAEKNLFFRKIFHRQWSIPYEILVVGWTFGVYGAVSLRISELSQVNVADMKEIIRS